MPQRSMRRYEISGFGASCPSIHLDHAGVFLMSRSSEGQGFILVYSIASRATFERLDVFRQSMLRVKRQKPIFMLVGNKADKQLEREVTREEGMQLAKEFGCEFLETSAKTALNVERLFTNLVRNLRSTKLAEQGSTVQPRKEPHRIKKCIIM
jgi:GTPase KRas protein